MKDEDLVSGCVLILAVATVYLLMAGVAIAMARDGLVLWEEASAAVEAISTFATLTVGAVVLPNENGPIVATLYGPADPDGSFDGRLARGKLTEADLSGPYAGDLDGFLAALGNGELYVSVHTSTNPGGEIRGRIGAR